MANDIVILTGYMALANLTKRALALTTGLQEVDSGTIDGYQGGEKAITVLCMVGSEKLGFMAVSARLLTGVSRAAVGLAIITNSTGIETGENKRKRHVYGLLKHKIYVASYLETCEALSLDPGDPVLKATSIAQTKNAKSKECRLLPHQVIACHWYQHMVTTTVGGGICADEMGQGRVRDLSGRTSRTGPHHV